MNRMSRGFTITLLLSLVGCSKTPDLSGSKAVGQWYLPPKNSKSYPPGTVPTLLALNSDGSSYITSKRGEKLVFRAWSQDGTAIRFKSDVGKDPKMPRWGVGITNLMMDRSASTGTLSADGKTLTIFNPSIGKGGQTMVYARWK